MMAPNVYCEGSVSFQLHRVLHGAFERLEPCEGRLSRTVLRGRGGSNAALLPGATLRARLMATVRPFYAKA